MPPKRKKKPNKTANVGLQISGSEAIQLKNEIQDKGIKNMSGGTLQRILGISQCFDFEGESLKGCKGKPTDPGCLCGVLPSVDSYRMNGLWAKAAGKNIETLEDADPKKSARKSVNTPIGLENLGNTCYINSVLQCLFAIEDFKHAILSAADIPQLEENHVFQSLKNIFVQMECGPRSSVDPESLISALRLDSSVQQDGQEFMKLFLTLLERSFEGIQEMQGKISKMFRGHLGYQTRCLVCNQLSGGSHRFDEFSELDIPIKGYTSLRDSLDSLLAPEVLDGDNQYFCDTCNCKQDATRQLIVKDLPPFLCLSLQRFVFDLKKMDRVKASDKFSFPLEIEESAFTHAGGEPVMYDLEGILLHKGSSAYQGHYVAHVAVNISGKTKPVWYRFDDTNVTRLEQGPAGHSDHGAVPKLVNESNKKVKGSKNIKTSKSKKNRAKDSSHESSQVAYLRMDDGIVIDLSCEDTTEVNGDITSFNENGAKEEENARDIVSSNAYMLVYKKRDGSKQKSALPSWVDESRKQMEDEFGRERARHEQLVLEIQQEVDHRRTVVREIINNSLNMNGDEYGRYVLYSWLQTWADAMPKDTILPIDNKPLLCDHGEMDPSKIQAAKRVSLVSWHNLESLYGGGPELSLKNLCQSCLLEQIESVIVAEDVEINRERFLEYCNVLDIDSKGMEISYDEGEESNGSDLYFVGKQWLRLWKNRKGISMGTTSPTFSLTCRHGLLVPDHPSKTSKRVLIPEEFWSYLKRCWFAQEAEKDRKKRLKDADVQKHKKRNSVSAPNGNDDGDTGDENCDVMPEENVLKEYKVGSEECKECKEEMASELHLKEEMGNQIELEKAALKCLLLPTANVEINSDVLYKLVPSSFMRTWRSYISTSSKVKAPTSSPKLEDFTRTVACFSHKCDSEQRSHMITYLPPKLMNRRGRWMAMNERDCAFEVIQESDWNALWQFYGTPEDPFGKEGVSVHLSVPLDSETKATEIENIESNQPEIISKSLEKIPQEHSVQQVDCNLIEVQNCPIPPKETQSLDKSEALKISFTGALEAVLITNPEVCRQCIQDRADAIRETMKHYEGKEILVEIASDESSAILETTIANDSDNMTSDHLMHAGRLAKDNNITEVISIKERKSKRARKGRSPVMVDSCTSIDNLKLRIFEALGLHPKNLRLFAKGAELLDEKKTLADYGILPMEELRVLNTATHDSNDLSSIFTDVNDSKGRENGKEGFLGTALVG